ncbi:MAG TPA: sulfur carrier protein ThiS [Verrucomicrobiales bacterium]|jgi:thiamine biosynthesis protein ThiS|nr:sulfur carrier protein ThiS [Verrucomicrobiales bacterium]
MEETAPVTIRLNGQPRNVPGGSHVTDLLASLGFAGQPVLVELNGTALFPRDFEKTAFKEGDGVEVIRIVAGG